MTSQERHEARYQRRRAARRARQEARCAALGSLEEVFSYHTMFKYGRKCCNGVRWKQSTQNFERHLFSHTAKQRRLILAKRWRPKKYVHFTVCERGKIRGIDAPHITDRQIHKVISKEVLEPLYDPSMIYDNGASRIGKGLHWQIKRIKQQLARHYRKYGRAGGVLLLDLKKFFPYTRQARALKFGRCQCRKRFLAHKLLLPSGTCAHQWLYILASTLLIPHYPAVRSRPRPSRSASACHQSCVSTHRRAFQMRQSCRSS